MSARGAVRALVGVAGVALTVVTPTLAAALCLPPVEVTHAAVEASVGYRYAWFLVESLSHARLAWEEAGRSADSQDSVVRLASFKLAIEDFQCAASLVQTFKGTPQRSDKPTTEELVQASASAATLAYTMFASGFQRWATALARGEGLPLKEAEEIKDENGWAGRSLMKLSFWRGVRSTNRPHQIPCPRAA